MSSGKVDFGELCLQRLLVVHGVSNVVDVAGEEIEVEHVFIMQGCEQFAFGLRGQTSVEPDAIARVFEQIEQMMGRKPARESVLKGLPADAALQKLEALIPLQVGKHITQQRNTGFIQYLDAGRIDTVPSRIIQIKRKHIQVVVNTAGVTVVFDIALDQ